jgi:hypothetical protein
MILAILSLRLHDMGTPPLNSGEKVIEYFSGNGKIPG